MKINNFFKEKKVVFSFEIFPPKTTSSIETIYETLATLSYLKPDFISVTYGAGGSITDNKTLELSSLVKNKYGIEALAHLTCINSQEEDINKILEALKDKGVVNVLALRGDIPNGAENIGHFNYANELVGHIKKRGDFGIAAACYPEGHMECGDFNKDVENLKRKVDAGVEHLISQLFFDNNLFYNFLETTKKKGIDVPIQAGIMPVTNKKQVERIVSLCGAQLPPKFMKIIDKYEHHPEALRDAGIAYAIDQIIDLISTDVDGIHLYTMNSPYVARKITDAIGTILSSVNNNNNNAT